MHKIENAAKLKNATNFKTDTNFKKPQILKFHECAVLSFFFILLSYFDASFLIFDELVFSYIFTAIPNGLVMSRNVCVRREAEI